MIDFIKAMADPSKIFMSPFQIVNCKDLSLQQKIDLLKQWEYDEREMDVAADENMLGESRDFLCDILQALHKLVDQEEEHTSPTKHGGHFETHSKEHH